MNILYRFVQKFRLLTEYQRRYTMTRPETIETYYERHPFLKTSDLIGEEGHFNAFKIDPALADDAPPIPYGRKDYFKICVVSGKSNIHYADKQFTIAQHGLFFAHPLIPYKWEPEGTQNGYSSIFTESFFHGFGNIKKYPFFQPGGYPVYELSPSEVVLFTDIFKQIEQEQQSDFDFRNDVLRNLVLQIIHTALKMRPSEYVLKEQKNASGRITSLFLELLENQFPITNTLNGLSLRSASGFAEQMSVHVNHLNKSVKEVTQKTTSALIAERILKEAKILLRHSSWAISEIAYSLGFEGPAHFSTFFRKLAQLSPSQYRNDHQHS